jgi:polar amino acid transport system permease protein
MKRSENEVETKIQSETQPLESEPEAIRAIPLKHYGRWIGAFISLVVAALIIRLFVVTPNINWPECVTT